MTIILHGTNYSSKLRYELTSPNGGYTYKAESNSNHWGTEDHRRLRLCYKANNKLLLQSGKLDHAEFYTDETCAFIDEELKKLKLKPAEYITLEFNSTISKTPTSSAFLKLLSYPEVEGTAITLVLGSLLCLASSMIGFAIGGVGAIPLLIAAGVAFLCGVIIQLAHMGSIKTLKNAPTTLGYDATVEQVGCPESKMQLSDKAKNILFFSRRSAPESEDNSDSDEITDSNRLLYSDSSNDSDKIVSLRK